MSQMQNQDIRNAIVIHKGDETLYSQRGNGMEPSGDR